MTTDEQIAEALRNTTNGGLLRTFASLTHLLHENDKDADTRARRDVVQAEILRRMGGES